MSNARNLARLTPNSSGQILDSNIGTISASKLSGSIPASVQTSGAVVQTLYYQTNSTSTSTATNVVWFDQTITPKLTNSKFLVVLDMKCSHTASNSLYFQLGINDNYDLASSQRSYPSATGSIYMESYGSSHSSNAQIDQYIGHFVYPQTTGAAVNFKVRSYLQGGTIYMNYSYSYDDAARGRPYSSLHIMEVVA